MDKVYIIVLVYQQFNVLVGCLVLCFFFVLLESISILISDFP